MGSLDLFHALNRMVIHSVVQLLLPALKTRQILMKYSMQVLLQLRKGLNTQTNQTYLSRGAINKLQFQ